MSDTNLTKKNRKEMIDFLEKIKVNNNDDETLRMVNKIENALTEKKFWLVFEEHREEVDDLLQANIPLLCEDAKRRICKDENLPWNFIIEWDNLQALYLLLKTHRWKINVIYIDPPYNTWARDWKYNNDYVDANDWYRHSKWLSMMKVRLELAKQLLNPENSVLICTIDEKEYLHLWCLLEEMFPEASIQMVSSCINPKWVARDKQFYRTDEYLFFICLWDAWPANLNLAEEWLDRATWNKWKKFRWCDLRRTWSNHQRSHSPGCFYPIYINQEGTKIEKIGDPLINQSLHPNDVQEIDGLKAIWPIGPTWEECVWQLWPSTLKKYIDEHYIRLWNFTKNSMSIWYVSIWSQKKIKDWLIKVKWYSEKDGSVIIDDDNYDATYIPSTQRNVSSHNATEYWSKLINKILWEARFSYPKSIYAVYDTIRFFIADNPNAIVLDFFAGSWTTMHAVNLMNAEDWWKRKCIMVTNNEIWEKEEKRLTALWYKKWDDEWEMIWIAKYVTRPRIECSVNWVDIHWKKLDWDYWFESETYILDEEVDLVSKETKKSINRKPYKKTKIQMYPDLAKLKMSDWFKTNVKYFKCDWTPRKPDDYYLSNVLLLHIKEMIELENAVEIDGIKNVAILNRDDYKKFIDNDSIYEKIENIWVNQNIIFDVNELEKMKKKNFKYIPVEYFWQELKDVAE